MLLIQSLFLNLRAALKNAITTKILTKQELNITKVFLLCAFVCVPVVLPVLKFLASPCGLSPQVS